MKNNKIKVIYQNKIKELQKHNRLYYQKSSPIISDNKFDNLKSEIIELEKNFNFLKSNLSPTFNVGFKPSKNFKKYKHRVQMLSLSNAFNDKDLANFEKKIFNYLNEKIIFEYSVEPKIDGISASLTYKNGILHSGASRGDGRVGELITENIKTIKNIPHEINDKNFPLDIEIRGEVFIKKKDFEKLKNNFANPRNAASGSLRQKNSADTKKIPLHFIAYTFGFFKDNKFKFQSDFLNALKKWGFNTSEYNRVIKDIKELSSFHKRFEEERYNLEYDVDGLVYKLNDLDLQKRLGFTSNAPRWAIAHKFSANNAYSEILNIDIQVGRTGALTPVAKIKPVNIGGVIVSNATLHNEDEITRKDIRLGDTVKIERAGDVIPHVVSVDFNKRKKKLIKFVFPKKCPSCGSRTEKEFNKITKKFDAVRRCTNEGYQCEKIAIEKIKHFISKEALNIDGLGKKVVEKFWDLNMIRLPNDIFNLDYNKISNLDGWGHLSVSNLKFSIEQSKHVSLDRFIYSIGIRHIGENTSQILAKEFYDLNNFISSANDNERLLNIDGLGPKAINSIYQYFSNAKNKNIILKLLKLLEIKNYNKPQTGNIFSDKNIVFTGTLSKLSREEAKHLAIKLGGKISSTVTSKTDFVVVGNKPGSKAKKAKELKIPILSEEEWINKTNQ